MLESSYKAPSIYKGILLSSIFDANKWPFLNYSSNCSLNHNRDIKLSVYCMLYWLTFFCGWIPVFIARPLFCIIILFRVYNSKQTKFLLCHKNMNFIFDILLRSLDAEYCHFIDNYQENTRQSPSWVTKPDSMVYCVGEGVVGWWKPYATNIRTAWEIIHFSPSVRVAWGIIWISFRITNNNFCHADQKLKSSEIDGKKAELAIMGQRLFKTSQKGNTWYFWPGGNEI